MNVPLWVWLATLAVVVGMLVFDFVGHARDPHEPTLRESAIWSVVYISIAVLLGMFVLDFLLVDSGSGTFTQHKATRWVLFYIALALAFAGFTATTAGLLVVVLPPAVTSTV